MCTVWVCAVVNSAGLTSLCTGGITNRVLLTLIWMMWVKYQKLEKKKKSAENGMNRHVDLKITTNDI